MRTNNGRFCTTHRGTDEEFDPTPLGAASLAQVHKAKLKDGSWVAVKIQHPKVKAHSRVDISTMEVSRLSKKL